MRIYSDNITIFIEESKFLKMMAIGFLYDRVQKDICLSHWITPWRHEKWIWYFDYLEKNAAILPLLQCVSQGDVNPVIARFYLSNDPARPQCEFMSRI